MKISTRGRYGLRVLLELASRGGDGPVQLKEVAKTQELSLNYIEHLIGPLVSAGFVKTIRGVSGGVMLAKRPRDIKVSDVIGLYEGSMAPVECVDNPDVCKRSGQCVTRDIWCELKKSTDSVLGARTVADLVKMQESKRNKEETMYYI
jgi:Rrf2 family transcriptional regulator, cysteine metabolism repressor